MRHGMTRVLSTRCSLYFGRPFATLATFGFDPTLPSGLSDQKVALVWYSLPTVPLDRDHVYDSCDCQREASRRAMTSCSARYVRYASVGLDNTRSRPEESKSLP